jgi:cytochrome c oxidase subunit II
MKTPGWDAPALQSTLDPASPQAQHISDLWWLFFWISVAVLSLVVLATLFALFRFRREPPPNEPLAEPGREPGLLRATVAAGVMTALVLLGLLGSSVATGRALAVPAAPEALKIRITGQRWWWQIEYPDPRPSRSVTTANELHVPVGRPVAIELTSHDVIHSLWIPELNGKRDLIPGRVTELRFVASRPGVFRGQCAEFCGLQHAHMGLVVVAENPERFVAWLDEQRAPAVEPPDPLARHGREVFLGATCPMCHSIRGTPAAAHVAPDLTHLGSRSTLAAATLPNNIGHLAGWVLDSQTIKTGNLMPPNALRPEDLHPLLQYLISLK